MKIVNKGCNKQLSSKEEFLEELDRRDKKAGFRRQYKESKNE